MNQRNSGGQTSREMTQATSDRNKLMLNSVLKTLYQRRSELEAVLPPDLPFEAFHATANQALRQNPDILDCEERSLIIAFVKAAYDGLRVDAREAAIVPEWATPPGGGRKVKQARYMPMYQGLVQQVLRGGMVLAMEADVAHENDVFKIQGGTDRKLIHEPLIVGDRGAMIAVYNIATLPSGLRVFAYLLRDDVIAIQKLSKTGWKDGQPAGVWKDHPREQWKKTVLRMHRKTLPIGLRIIHDSEQADEFPQFNSQQQAPAIAHQPQQRPTRAMIENRQGTEAGQDLDYGQGYDGFGGYDSETGELIENERQQDPRDQQQVMQEQQVDQQQAAEREAELPADGAEWAMWEEELAGKMRKAPTAEALDAIWAEAQPIYKQANKATKDRLSNLVTERTTDLALGDE